MSWEGAVREVEAEGSDPRLAYTNGVYRMSRFNSDDAALPVSAAREDRGLSQAALAAAAGMRQPHIAAIEAGRRRVSGEVLERILRAADYRPSVALEFTAEQIRELAARHGIGNVRVFGSTVRGADHFGSDIDLIGTVQPGRSYFDIGAFMAEAEQLTGFPIDFALDGPSLPAFLAETESVPL